MDPSDDARTRGPREDTPPVLKQLRSGPWNAPPGTPEERLERLRSMGEKIGGYIRFMCDLERLVGASAEAKEKSLVAFYDRLVTAERQLGLIQEKLRLE